MPLLGQAAVAMWWTIDPALRSEFEDWHSHEHFPERMGIPGFQRGSRWASTTDSEGFFVLYELSDYETLTSKGYLDRLNDPTPWSTKMMPHHRNMMRSQARVLGSYGGGIGGFVATVRLSPQPGASTALADSLGASLTSLASKPGLTGAHLLVTETPMVEGLTTEQRIRGNDSKADWIVIISGYDQHLLLSALEKDLSAAMLHRMGALAGVVAGTFSLSFCLTPAEAGPARPG